MVNKNVKKRWTIINIDEDIKDAIVAYSNENGYTVARAIKELTKKDLRRWKKKSQKQ